MNTDKSILQELNQRRSVRAFLPKEVEPGKLEALWAAAQWAPSSSNKQEWRYYAFIGQAREKLAEVLNRGNWWALRAPLIIAVTRDASIENKTESREYGMYDVALSVMSLVVEAEHQGLRAHQLAGFKEKPLKQILNLSQTELPAVVVAVGYEGGSEHIDPEVRSLIEEKEARPRVRKPIEGVVKIIKDL